MKVYSVPFTSPSTRQRVAGAVAVHDPPAGDEVTSYSSIAADPALAGTCQLTVARLSPATAVTLRGAVGALEGLGPGAEFVNSATAVCAADMATVHVVTDPVQAPDHPSNDAPWAGTAVRVTEEPDE